MKTERAIELLNRISDSQFDGIHGDERREALEMAVKALFSQQTVNDSQGLVNDCISRKAVMKEFADFVRKSNNSDFEPTPTWNDAVSLVGSMPPAQPQACDDAISRDDAIMAVKTGALSAATIFGRTDEGATAYYETVKAIKALPFAQPERTCVNCGRTVNNGGWYADGGTRCPIEEHYALPKDGYCHLWEKRNVTDDDYPERREE